MSADTLKGFALPLIVLGALEALAATRGIQSDSIAAPSAVALALVELPEILPAASRAATV